MDDEKKPRKDKRSQRTRVLIAEAMQALLQKDAFSSITVNDICIEAEVSRATFYLYFEDKFHLLRFIIGQWGEAIRQMADPASLASLVDAILETMYGHRRLIHNILLADKNEEVHAMVHRDFVDAMARAFEMQQAAGVRVCVPVRALSVFCAAGITYMIVWWLEGGIEATREEMCDCLIKIAEGRAVIDADDPRRPAERPEGQTCSHR